MRRSDALVYKAMRDARLAIQGQKHAGRVEEGLKEWEETRIRYCEGLRRACEESLGIEREELRAYILRRLQRELGRGREFIVEVGGRRVKVVGPDWFVLTEGLHLLPQGFNLTWKGILGAAVCGFDIEWLIREFVEVERVIWRLCLKARRKREARRARKFLRSRKLFLSPKDIREEAGIPFPTGELESFLRDIKERPEAAGEMLGLENIEAHIKEGPEGETLVSRKLADRMLRYLFGEPGDTLEAPTREGREEVEGATQTRHPSTGEPSPSPEGEEEEASTPHEGPPKSAQEEPQHAPGEGPPSPEGAQRIDEIPGESEGGEGRLDEIERRLRGSPLKVFRLIRSRWGGSGEGVEMSVREISRLTGLSETTITNSLRLLEAMGLIRREVRWKMGDGRGRPQIILPGPELKEGKELEERERGHRPPGGEVNSLHESP